MSMAQWELDLLGHLARGEFDKVREQVDNYADDHALPALISVAIYGLLEKCEQLQDPGFHAFVAITDRFLVHYPADLFTGESGDPGPVFVAGLRKAREAYAAARAARGLK
jgi:hypothetical protein